VSSTLSNHFLVAVPQLVGPFFAKSIVLIIDNSNQGSTGIVLNQPTDHTVSELNKNLKTSRRGNDRLFLGGPVDPSAAIVVHDEVYQGPDTKRVTDSLAMSKSLESLLTITQSESITFRCFIGYAGWASGQLEAEIALGNWLLNPVIPELVFTDQPEGLWDSVLSEMGLDPLTIGHGAFD
jgi:putative transcriptional regulator